jgi:hypothetical protein
LLVFACDCDICPWLPPTRHLVESHLRDLVPSSRCSRLAPPLGARQQESKGKSRTSFLWLANFCLPLFISAFADHLSRVAKIGFDFSRNSRTTYLGPWHDEVVSSTALMHTLPHLDMHPTPLPKHHISAPPLYRHSAPLLASCHALLLAIPSLPSPVQTPAPSRPCPLAMILVDAPSPQPIYLPSPPNCLRSTLAAAFC